MVRQVIETVADGVPCLPIVISFIFLGDTYTVIHFSIFRVRKILKESKRSHLPAPLFYPCPLSQAPARVVSDKKRALTEQHGESFARAEIGSSGANPKNGKRQYSRLVRKFKLSLNISVSEYTCSDGPRAATIPYLKPSDVLTTLLQNYPWLLLGGCEMGADSERMILKFWDAYKLEHPTHSVFKHDRARLSRTIPLTVHGDGGRTQKKQPLEVFSFEPTLGLNSSGGGKPCKCRCDVPTTYGAHGDFGNPLMHMVNSKYNSLLSHFLIFAYPSKKYKTFPNLLDGLLRAVFTNLAGVCETGIVSATGERFYVACLGFKLDMEWGVKAAQLQRSYQNVGYKNEIACCAECDAGIPGVPFEDCNDNAAWLGTCFNTLPWSTPPPWSSVPFDQDCPAKFLRRDAFHIFRLGVARNFIGSAIILLCYMGCF